LGDEKEKAEHIMLVDLGRNDVGRVAETGTVKVTELMGIERYSHVMHIYSNVAGSLADGKNAFDVLRAAFPAGTVSGAPKIRAMEIIEELEPVQRGPYAGAVGYFGFSGNMDTCITIRSVLIKNGKTYVQVGAGIVADSAPEKEYEETLNKAQAIFKAIRLAEEGLR
jgi:anthranilate synthase component 1